MTTPAIAALSAATEIFVVKYGSTSVLHVYFDSAEKGEAWMWEVPRLPSGIDALKVRVFCGGKNYLDFEFTRAQLEAHQKSRIEIDAWIADWKAKHPEVR